MYWVNLLKFKNQALEKLKIFKEIMENELKLKIKCLRCDRGGEFVSDEFFNFCVQYGIKQQLSIDKTPQQNGVT